MDATEKETVHDTIDNIKKIVGDNIPYLQLQKQEEAVPEQHIETDEEIDGSIKTNFQEFLGEETDGQMSLVMNEQAQVERQITGQITIEDVLEEWEKTKRAAEAALQEAEQRKLESAKARALQEAGDIMDRLNNVIPRLDAGVSPRELLEEEYLQANTGSMQELGAEIAEEIIPEEVPAVEDAVEEPAPEEPEPEPIPQPAEDHSKVEVDEVVAKASTKRMPFADDNGYMTSWKMKTANLPEIAMPDDLDLAGETSGATVIDHLTDEQKAIFSYFVPVKGMESQLCQVLTGAVRHLKEDKTASTGNIIIQGGQGCGKTMLATSIIKVLQKECGRPNGKVGKIDALALNKKDIQSLLRKVAGGCLIIERAGDLTREAEVTLSLLLAQDNSGILVILEDTTKGIRKALTQDDGFAKKFTQSVTVPIFTNDELVSFARAYAKELGYEIDEMAVLALYNRISNIQRLDQATTLTEVKDIVDEAIDREAHGGIKKAISILTAARYTDDDCIVLREKDFN
jgi:hypothetical protein